MKPAPEPTVKKCAHVGCRVYIKLADQPRRYALGFCRTHEVEGLAARKASKQGIRQASVVGHSVHGATGALAVTLVSLPKEPWV